jgi:hypothetical protein
MTSVTVKQISNGFIVATYSNGGLPPAPGTVETYCADLAAVNALLATVFA